MFRVREPIQRGEDIEARAPIAAVLDHTALSTHCSACFAALSCQSRHPPHDPIDSKSPLHDSLPICDSPLYCSHHCAVQDTLPHVASGERALLFRKPKLPRRFRLALRLAHIFADSVPNHYGLPTRDDYEEFFESKTETDEPERIMGLLTNREKLVLAEKRSGVRSQICLAIQRGAELLDRVREDRPLPQFPFKLMEMVICLVLTNGVAVVDKNGIHIGTAVYDLNFSLINHSCSPNSRYRFLFGRSTPGLTYGPKVIVRSIKDVAGGEELTVAYMNLLLQPKRVRDAELWTRYRFICSCDRCSDPENDVDWALQALIADNPENPKYSDEEIKNMLPGVELQYVKDLGLNVDIKYSIVSLDPVVRCPTLEYLLCYGEFSDASTEPPQMKKLHPMNRHCIDAYEILTATYHVQADKLLIEGNDEARYLYKTSAAYSLLLAGVVNYLYSSEPAIVANAAFYWLKAGNYLLSYVNSVTPAAEPDCLVDEPELVDPRCDDCSAINGSGTDLENRMQSELYKCIARITSEVWGFLSSQGTFLKYIQNPVDLMWLGSAAASGLMLSDAVEEILDEDMVTNLHKLGIHCLMYGALLSTPRLSFSPESTYYDALLSAGREMCLDLRLDLMEFLSI